MSPTSFICLPVLFICLPVLFIFGLPGWVLVVGFPAGLSPTSLHLFPISSYLSPNSFHLSPRLGACSRVSGRLVFVSHFSPSSLLLGVFNSFVRCVSPLCVHCLSAHFHWPFVAHFLFMYLPGLSLLVPALFRLAMSAISYSCISHFLSLVVSLPCLWSLQCGMAILICLPVSLLVSALFTVDPTPLFICLPVLSPQFCHCWCPLLFMSPNSLLLGVLNSFISHGLSLGVHPAHGQCSISGSLCLRSG